MLNEIEYLNYKILYKEKEIKERELELINKEKIYEKIKLEKDFETKRNNEILKTEKKIQEINYNKKYDILTSNYKKEELNLKNRIEELENDNERISLNLKNETEMWNDEKEFNNKFLTLKNKKYTNLSNQLSEEEKRSNNLLEFYKKTNSELQSSIFREIENSVKEYIKDSRRLRELNFEFNKKEEEILKKKQYIKEKKSIIKNELRKKNIKLEE